VVAAERDDTRQRPALALPTAVDLVVTRRGRSLEPVLKIGMGLGRAGKHRVVAPLNLFDGVGVVVAGDGDVAAVDDGGPAGEGVGLQRHIVSSCPVISKLLVAPESLYRWFSSAWHGNEGDSY
jgi:hypothetical protein